MELYIHIPFCVKKCAYCDFLSFPADEGTQQNYVEALKKELEFYGKKYGGRTVSTIFIGGGTPSWIDGDQLVAIMETANRCFHVERDAEVTIECNPGTVTGSKLTQYREAGINRLSIGLQSTHNNELKILGRIHTYEQFLRTYELARTHGFRNINVDLMSSLPGQTPAVFRESLERVIRLRPEHISAYALIIEKGTPFYDIYRFDSIKQRAGMQTESLPTEEEEYETTKMAQRMLKEAGYHWYEVSNFARPGYECRHNIGYWTREEYLGVGLGAASLLNNIRYTNVREIYDYLEGCRNIRDGLFENKNEDGSVEELPAVNLHESAVKITRRAQMEEFMFLGLRMIDGIRRDDFKRAFGGTIEGVYGDVLGELQQEELLIKREGRIFLTDKGQDLSNYVLAKFLMN